MERPDSPPFICRTGQDDNFGSVLTEDDTAERETFRHPLRCRQCGHPVTGRELQCSVSGSHYHAFFNPAGILFEIGCFRDAPGCLTAGPLTDEFSWFSGYRWRFALCAVCGSHLGWQYRGSDSFFGLILSSLSE